MVAQEEHQQNYGGDQDDQQWDEDDNWDETGQDGQCFIHVPGPTLLY